MAANTVAHSHNWMGAGSEAKPSELTQVRVASAAAAPIATLTGNHTSRRRRVRQPITAITTTAAATCTAAGSQPPSSETP